MKNKKLSTIILFAALLGSKNSFSMFIPDLDKLPNPPKIRPRELTPEEIVKRDELYTQEEEKRRLVKEARKKQIEAELKEKQQKLKEKWEKLTPEYQALIKKPKGKEFKEKVKELHKLKYDLILKCEENFKPCNIGKKKRDMLKKMKKTETDDEKNKILQTLDKQFAFYMEKLEEIDPEYIVLKEIRKRMDESDDFSYIDFVGPKDNYEILKKTKYPRQNKAPMKTYNARPLLSEVSSITCYNVTCEFTHRVIRGLLKNLANYHEYSVKSEWDSNNLVKNYKENKFMIKVLKSYIKHEKKQEFRRKMMGTSKYNDIKIKIEEE